MVVWVTDDFLSAPSSLSTLIWALAQSQPSGKTPVNQQFLKYSDQFVWYRHPCSKSLKLLSSTFWCVVWTSASHFDNVYMPKYIELLQCDWLIRCLMSSSVDQVYLTSEYICKWKKIIHWGQQLNLFNWRHSRKGNFRKFDFDAQHTVNKRCKNRYSESSGMTVHGTKHPRVTGVWIEERKGYRNDHLGDQIEGDQCNFSSHFQQKC